MSNEIKTLKYDMLNDVKYGDKYRIAQDGNEVYHCSKVNEDAIAFVRKSKDKGIFLIVDKEESISIKDITGLWSKSTNTEKKK